MRAKEFITEITMSPSNLSKEVKKIGAMAGMEFEMIVPGASSDGIEPDYQPDYDQDRRARSFNDVRDFFYDGDSNSRRDVDNLISQLTSEYEEWVTVEISDDWANEGQDYVRDYIANNDLFDRDDATSQAREEIIEANPDLPEESEEFTELLSERLTEMETEFADTAFEDRGRIHDQAYDDFTESQRDEYDEGSFLDDEYHSMSDIQNHFDISWPHYIDMNDGEYQDGADIDTIGNEFGDYMGKPVNTSSRYHGGRREAGHYVVEPDSSLEADDDSDSGLEFVSPPMTIDELLADLKKVKTWADKTGCYTNESTGLHINISVPGYSLEKLDYVKLALLMGDEYVLELFGRSGNTYARSAISKITSMLQKNPDLAPQIMDKMRSQLADVATKAIHSGVTEKYTSINTKDGYIEFRSPGGDWLGSNFNQIENTLLRFTVALASAIDPEAYRQEYLKKLYKMLSGIQTTDGLDVVQLFANYSAGSLDKAALIRQVRAKQLSRNVERGTVARQQYWWSVQWDADRRMEVVANNKGVAREVAARKWGVPVEQLVIAKVTMLRPYEPAQAAQPAQPAQVSDGTFQGTWAIQDGNRRTLHTFSGVGNSQSDANRVARNWVQQNMQALATSSPVAGFEVVPVMER